MEIKLRWGEFKGRSSKPDLLPTDASPGFCASSYACEENKNDTTVHAKPESEFGFPCPSSQIQDCGGKLLRGLAGLMKWENPPPKPIKLRIKSKKVSRDPESPSQLKFITPRDVLTRAGEEAEGCDQPSHGWGKIKLINHNYDSGSDIPEADAIRRTRSMGLKATSRENAMNHTFKQDEGGRYIPLLGDEVIYLRQKNIRAVEFCLVEGLRYCQVPGAGDGGCKIALTFTDPSSSVLGEGFKFTLAELKDFPDFVVERTRYDAAILRNWTCRDECKVWWRDPSGEGGSWWKGWIVSS
ncbi:WD40 domain-containing protein [Actinidia rufa]|uniref:WD40 domain-containing protein n=1 Tax=Actinidia rufa TaxID=165716 RepID=A0A7J0DED0_9ERIC|nr:WD40 domain-containing protein [Actinidia rufa]